MKLTKAQQWLLDNNIDKSKFLFPYVEYIDDTKNKSYWEDKVGNYRIMDYTNQSKIIKIDLK